MPLSRLNESDEDHDQPVDTPHVPQHGDWDEDDISLGGLETPLHPVSAMQEAFEESIREALDEESEPNLEDLDAEGRRRALLDRDEFDDSWTTRWKQKPSAKCHPIVKLMAQIIFGLHLLHNQQAKSDAEVVKILQSHVDEIDGFLEKTTEDFDLAIRDIQERIAFLQLPMNHVEVFDVMLQDRRFRNQLISGNVKIERIIERTAKAMNASLLDIQKGVNTVHQLSQYLDRVGADWPQTSVEEAAILVAMRGNEEGWRACFGDLQAKGNKLGVALVKLGTIVGEMNKMAAAASKRSMTTKPSKASSAVPTSRYADGQHGRHHQRDIGPDERRTTRSKSNRPQRQVESEIEKSNKRIVDKPLPKAPDMMGAALKATIPRAHPVHLGPPNSGTAKQLSERPLTPLDFMQSRQLDALPPEDKEDTNLQIERTSQMVPRAPCSPNTSQTKELAGFIRDGRPNNDNLVRDSNHSDRPQPRRQADDPITSPEPGRSNHSRQASDSIPRSIPGNNEKARYSDSAYASGTEQKVDRSISPLSSTPSKFGLFPSPGPTTPVMQSRSPSLGNKTASPNYTTAPGRASMPPSSRATRSPSFSIRRMFNKKPTEQPVSG